MNRGSSEAGPDAQGPARPVRILVTNVHSVRNSGDRVLLDVALDLLYRRFPGAQITLAMNDPMGYPAHRPEQVIGSFTGWFKSGGPEARGWRLAAWLAAPVWLLLIGWAAWRIARQPCNDAFAERVVQSPWLRLCFSPEQRRLLLAYFQAQVVVSCAGNFLYSSGRVPLSYGLHLLALVYGAWAGKPVYMLPQTLGPFRARWETWLLGRALGRVQVVMVRDAASQQLLEDAGIRHPGVWIVPDIAFLFRGHDAAFAAQFFARAAAPGRPRLGVSLIDWQAQHGMFGGQAAYEDAVATAIRAFVKEYDGTAILFAQVFGPTSADDDRIPAARVAAQLADLGERVVQVQEILSPDQLKACYGGVDIFLGTRLHANIFALCEGRPVLAVAYQPKTHGIMSMLGLEAWVIDLEDAHGNRLAEDLTRLWQARASVSHQVAEAVAAVQVQAQAAVDRIDPIDPIDPGETDRS